MALFIVKTQTVNGVQYLANTVVQQAGLDPAVQYQLQQNGGAVYAGPDASGLSAADAAALAGQRATNFYPLSATTTGIKNSAIDALDAGGGVVKIPRARSTPITEPLPVLPGVLYDAQNPVLSSLAPDLSTSYVLAPTGNFNCFAGNADPVATPPADFASFAATQIVGGGVINALVIGGRNGIAVGNRNIGGWMRARLFNVVCLNASEWGFWLINYFHLLEPGMLRAAGNAIGQIARGCLSGVAGVNTGNTVWGYLNFEMQGTQQGMIEMSGNYGSLYEDSVVGIGCAAAGTRVSQQFTFAAGSPNITVANPGALTADMPVYFPAPAYGIADKEPYFVKTIVGSQITLSKQRQGPTFTAAAGGNGSQAVLTFGHAPIVVFGDTTASAQPSQHFDVSVEGGPQPANIICSNAPDQTFFMQLAGYNQSAVDPDENRVMVFKASPRCNIYGALKGPGSRPWSQDDDSPNCYLYGSMGSVNGAGYPQSPANIPKGIWTYDGSFGANGTPAVASNTAVLSLRGNGAPEGYVPTTPYAGFGWFVTTLLRQGEMGDNGTLFSQGLGNLTSLSIGANGAVSLPLASRALGSSNIGLWGMVFNPTANVGTVNRSGSDPILVGGTNPVNTGSFKIPPYGMAWVFLMLTANQTVPYWAVAVLPNAGIGGAGNAPFVDTASLNFAAADQGTTRAPTGTLTYTLSASTAWVLAPGGSTQVYLPASGTISFSASGATINGGTTTLTRTLAGNPLGYVAVHRIQGSNAYSVSGS